MELIIAPILFIGMVLYVAYPLLWGSETRAEPPPQAPPTDRQAILREKEDVVANLKDIEMDFRMGKLSPQDYEDLKSEYEVRAAEVFEQVEALERKRIRKTRA
jgi:hypothetical protein